MFEGNESQSKFQNVLSAVYCVKTFALCLEWIWSLLTPVSHLVINENVILLTSVKHPGYPISCDMFVLIKVKYSVIVDKQLYQPQC